MHQPDGSVYIFQTGLTGYSQNWLGSTFPEGQALAALTQFVQVRKGYDLFGRLIKPGDRVVVKPNLVRNWHYDGRDLYSMITHPALIRAIVDQIYRALQGEGQIIIADAPLGDTDFQDLLAVTRLAEIADLYWREHRFEVTIRDLRQFRYRHETRPGGYQYEVRSPLAGDPEGYAVVDLGSESAFQDLSGIHLLEGTDPARRKDTIISHSQGVNRYLVSRTMLDADVLIHVPKLKTHSKVGVTVNCKGMVGINGDKNWLPHFRWGSPSEGGDQFPEGAQKAIDKRRMKLGVFVGDTLLARQTAWADAVLRIVQSLSGAAARLLGFKAFDPINGDWPGNDTCWRLAADLVRVAIFAAGDGELRATPQRRFLSIVDGIVGGEGDGPLRPTPKPCGILLAGEHPLAVDLVAARLMGFDRQQIRYLQALCAGSAAHLRPGFGPFDLESVEVHSNDPLWDEGLAAGGRMLAFDPPSRWVGHLEIGPPGAGYDAEPVLDEAAG